MASKVKTLPPKEYWEERAMNSQKNMVKSSTEVENKIERLFRSTTKNVNKEVRSFYKKYGELNKSPVYKTLPDGTRVIKGYNKKITVPYNKAITKFGKSNTSRLDRFNRSIEKELKELTRGTEELMEDILATTYDDTYYKTIHDVQKGIGLGTSFRIIPQTQIRQAIKFPWSGANYSSRLWTNQGRLTKNLNNTMRQGILKGNSVQEMTRELDKKMGSGYKNAERLIRTEMTYSSNDATFEGYKASGFIEEYEYMSVEDNRTSTICTELDGQHFTLEEKAVGVNYPPTHPNCRSTTSIYFPENDTVSLVKDDDGIYYEVPKNTSYQNWKNNTVGDKTRGMSKPKPDLKRGANPEWDSYFDKDNRVVRPQAGSTEDYKYLVQRKYREEVLSTDGELYKNNYEEWRKRRDDLDRVGRFDERDYIYNNYLDEVLEKTDLEEYTRGISEFDYDELRDFQDEVFFRQTGIDLKNNTYEEVRENLIGDIELPEFEYDVYDWNGAKRVEVRVGSKTFGETASFNYTDDLGKTLEKVKKSSSLDEMEEALSEIRDEIDDLKVRLRDVDFDLPIDEEDTYLGRDWIHDTLDLELESKKDSAVRTNLYNAIEDGLNNTTKTRNNISSSVDYNNMRVFDSLPDYEMREFTTTVDRASKFLDRTLHKDIQNELKDKLDIQVNALGKDARAFARLDSINLAYTDTSTTVVHEMGHVIHDNVNGLNEAINKWFEVRTKGEKLKSIYPDVSHLADEVGYKDKFISHYIGKDYGNRLNNQRGTEVLSMGMQYMNSSPSSFLQEDEDMFKFIYGLMKGAY